MASLSLAETEHDPCDPDNVYFFGKQTSSFEPTTFIDMSEYEDTKTEAIEAQESQVEFLDEHDGIDAEFNNLVEGVLSENRTTGRRIGASYAEGFAALVETADEYIDRGA